MILISMILNYLISVLTALKIMIHAGTYFAKIKSTIKLGFLISPLVVMTEKAIALIIGSVEKWTIDNSDYIGVVLVAIAIDHILGTIKHLKIKDFTVKKNLVGLMTKIGLVVACGFLFEGLNIIIHKETFVKDYLTIVTRLIVFLYPAGSAFGNSTFLSNGKFPPQSWLDKLKHFQKNLNPSEFSSKNNNNQNNF